jgi:hypothetical protein
MSNKAAFLALALVSSLSLVMLSLSSASYAALGPSDLLTNGDFEAGTSSWSASYAATFYTVTSPVQSGSSAAALNRSETTGEIRIYQDVSVVPGATYTLTGQIYKDESFFEYALLRIEWWNSQWPDLNSNKIFDDNPFYRAVTVGPTIAPPDASTARISAVAKIRTAGPENPMYFDDLSLTSNLVPRSCLPLVLNSP